MVCHSSLRTSLRGFIQSIGAPQPCRYGALRLQRGYAASQIGAKDSVGVLYQSNDDGECGDERQENNVVRRVQTQDGGQKPAKTVVRWVRGEVEEEPKQANGVVRRLRSEDRRSLADVEEKSFEAVVEQGERRLSDRAALKKDEERKLVRQFDAHYLSAQLLTAKLGRQRWEKKRAKEDNWRTALRLLQAEPASSQALHHTAPDEAEEGIESLLDDITYEPLPESSSIPLRGIMHYVGAATDRLRLRPARLTPLTFSAYVHALTRQLPGPPVSRSHLLEPEQRDARHKFIAIIGRELYGLFVDADNIALITSEVLQRCVLFMTECADFPHLWPMFQQLQARKYSFAPSTLELLLDAAVREPNVRNFTRALRLHPALGTKAWALLHRLVCRAEPAFSHEVVDALREKLGADFRADVELMRDVTLHRVAVDLGAHEGTIQDFLTSYTARYGPEENWLQPNIRNHLIQLLLTQNRTAEARSLAQKIPQATTLNLFLQSLLSPTNSQTVEARQAYLATAISYLPHFAADKLTYSHLFTLAGCARAYNVSRALWRHGCATGQLRSGVRALVWDGLAMKPGPERNMWDVCMGKFVVGVADGVDGSASASFRPFLVAADRDESEQNQAVEESLNVEEGQKLSETQLFLLNAARKNNQSMEVEERLRRLFDADVESARTLRPKEALPDLLARAWELDREWKRVGESNLSSDERDPGHGSVFGEMLRQGLKVEMEFG